MVFYITILFLYFILFLYYTRLPPRKDIIGRYHTLLEHIKGKKARFIMITGELISLWLKFSFPCITKQAIISKLRNLITDYE